MRQNKTGDGMGQNKTEGMGWHGMAWEGIKQRGWDGMQ